MSSQDILRPPGTIRKLDPYGVAGRVDGVRFDPEGTFVTVKLDDPEARLTGGNVIISWDRSQQ